jgi:hypothetical protein
VINGAVDPRARSRDLGLEQRDPLLQFLDRQGIEILLRELGDQIARLPGQGVVDIHPASVTAHARAVKSHGPRMFVPVRTQGA